MKNIFIIGIIIPLLSFGQKIYVTDYAYQADIKVAIVDYAYQADLGVYKVGYSYQTGKNNG